MRRTPPPAKPDRAFHFGGQTGCVVYRDRNGWEFRCWAERGLVHYEDSRDNSYGSFPDLRQCLLHLRNVNAMLGISTNGGIEIDASQRKALQTFVEQMIELVRKAREQGNPFDRLKKLSQGNGGSKSRTRVMIPKSYFVD